MSPIETRNSVGFGAPILNYSSVTSAPANWLANHPGLTCISESQYEASSNFTDSQMNIVSQDVSKGIIIFTDTDMISHTDTALRLGKCCPNEEVTNSRSASLGWKHNSLPWRHNGHDGASSHQPNECLLNRSSRRRSKKTSKLRVTGLCVGNSPETGEFPAQMASNAEKVSIWWRHHVTGGYDGPCQYMRRVQGLRQKSSSELSK